MRSLKSIVFLLLTIGIMSCGEDEKFDPSTCGEFQEVFSPNLVIDEKPDGVDLLKWPSGFDSITTDGLPKGLTFGDFWGRLAGIPEEAGEFTVTLSGTPSDDRCPTKITTTTITVQNKPVECDEPIDCGVLVFDSNKHCAYDSGCLGRERCFSVTPDYTVCNDPSATCGSGTAQVLYPLANGGTDTICVMAWYDDYTCNERGHCISKD